MELEAKISLMRKAFNEIDPVGIFFDENTNEYDAEISELLTADIDLGNFSEVKKELIRIFTEYFGGIKIDEDKLEQLSREIVRLSPRMKVYRLDYSNQSSEKMDLCPQFIPVLDDRVIDGSSLMVFYLEMSAKEDGVYPILNCICGEWGCGGELIRVKNEQDVIIWEHSYGSWCGDGEDELGDAKKFFTILGVRAPLFFERENYQEVIQRLLLDKEKNKEEKSSYEFALADYKKDPSSIHRWF